MYGTFISTGIVLDESSTFAKRVHERIASVDFDQKFGRLSLQTSDPSAFHGLAAALQHAAMELESVLDQ